jgi:hypothetical protein
VTIPSTDHLHLIQSGLNLSVCVDEVMKNVDAYVMELDDWNIPQLVRPLAPSFLLML